MPTPKRLFRRSSSGRIAGVCAGIAEYMDADVTLIRLLWILLSIVPGALIGGLVAYLVAWVLMPNTTEPIPAGRRRLARSTSDRRIAGVCSGFADYFNLDSTVVRVLWAVATILPGAIVFGIVAYVVAWFIMPSQPAMSATPAAQTA